jgi:transcriptional regulator with XRE-family HTH domain
MSDATPANTPRSAQQILDELTEILTHLESGETRDESSPNKTSKLSAKAKRQLRASAKERLVDFRKLLGLGIEDFAKRAGVTTRTVARWQSGSPPKVLQVRTWYAIFTDDLRRQISEDYAPDALPLLGNPIAGVFSLKTLAPRIRDATSVWCLKHRYGLHAEDSTEIRELFKSLFADRSDFTLNCVWIKPGDDPDPSLLSDVFPAKVVPASFVNMFQHTFAGITGVENKILGFELTREEGFKYGISNLPVSVLVLLYDRQESREKYQRDVDVFLEIPAETYNPGTGSRTGEQLYFWAQVRKKTAYDYYTSLWRRFAKMNQVNWHDVQAQLTAPQGKSS